MQILITGINGFVGTNLVEALKDFHTIYGLDIIENQNNGIVNTFNWEDLKRNNLPAFDAIIHLAGIAHDTKNIKTEADYFNINLCLSV